MPIAKTETINVVDINALTNEVIVRQANEEELTQRDLDNAEFVAIEAAKLAKAQARQSALAKLAELGLTEEEIAAL